MRLSVVIPNFNGRELLEKNLTQILLAVETQDIVIVDDGSTDSSLEFLKTRFPKIKVIEKVTNSGFATAVNLGMRAVTGDVVLLLNTDAVPKKGFWKYIMPHFENERVFAVGLLDESRENGITVERGRGIGKFTQGFLVHARGEVSEKDTLWANGGSSVFRRTLWQKLGGMSEIYNPFYWEDIDLSYRALKSGYQVIFEPSARVVHAHEEGSIKKYYSPDTIKRIAYRNQFIFVWTNITSYRYLFEHLLWLPYHIIMSVARLDGAFIGGMLAALIKLPLILRQRQLSKRDFMQPDEAILARFRYA